jgi:exonuclease I
MKLIKERARRLAQPGLLQKVARIYSQSPPPPSADPDAALYDGFLQDEDRSRCLALHAEAKAGRWQDLDFKDKRLATLAQRMKARSYPALLGEDEVADWRSFVAEKLTGEGDWMNLASFQAAIDAKVAAGLESDEQAQVLEALSLHAEDIRLRYQL